MRVTRQILNSGLETLEIRKRRCQSLGYQAAGCVTNVNYSLNINVLYPSKSMSRFTMIFNFYLSKGIYC